MITVALKKIQKCVNDNPGIQNYPTSMSSTDYTGYVMDKAGLTPKEQELVRLSVIDWSAFTNDNYGRPKNGRD